MAIINSLNGLIVPGNGIDFTQNATGAIVVSTSQSSETTVVDAIATFADVNGTLQSSGVAIDSSGNITGANNVSCAELALDSNNSNYVSLSSPSGLTATVNYTMPSTIGDAGNLLIINTVSGNTANLTWSTSGGEGIITTVNGTTGRIDVSSGAAPNIDIDAAYVGQASITTLGTITTGTWSGANLNESQITNLSTSLASCEKFANKGAANGYAGLDANELVPVANIPALPESQITNLSTNLAACELSAHKAVASGYCPLDSNVLVPVANIPALAESQITNLTTDLAACEKSAHKDIPGGYAPLDSNVLVPIANIPELPESQITNLTSDLLACEKTINKAIAGGYCPLDNSMLVPLVNLPNIAESKVVNLVTDLAACEKTANKGVASGYASLDSSSLVPVANIPNITESMVTGLVSNLGTINTNISTLNGNISTINTALTAKADLVGGVLQTSEIPTSVPLTINAKTTSNNTITLATTDIANCESTTNKNVANGYAPLDSNGFIPLANLGDCISNAITLYVDNKYSGSVNDGSILKPFTTIMAAINTIGGAPTSNSDVNLMNRFIIHINGGQYDEDLTIPGSRHITLLADGMVVLGDGNSGGYSQYYATSTTVRNVNIQLFQNTAQTHTYFRETTILATTVRTQHGAPYTYEGLEAGWQISGVINICALTGGSFADSEMQFNQVRCVDQSATGWFINNTSTATTWTGNINVRCVGCRGNGINFGYSANFNNFNLYETTECYFIGMLNVARMGSMNHTTFYASGGFAANTLTGISSTYQPYYSQMIDCACQTGSSFSTTSANTLFIDKATWVKSNGAITTTGSLTLNIDYGFPNQSAFTGLVNGQVITWNSAGNGFVNTTPSAGVTQLSLLSDCSTSSVVNDQLLVYTTGSALNKWTPYTLSGATFNDSTHTITVSSGGVTSNVATTNQTTVSAATGVVTIGLASNPVLPGTAGVTLPQGDTSTRAGAAGTIRFNGQTSVFEGTVDGTNWATFESSAIGVISVAGTLGYITCSSTTGNVVVNIDPAYIGQSSITTVGTVTSGYWHAGILAGTYGGTGINNGASTITIGGNFSTVGAYTAALTCTANTAVTLPVSGTLATTSQIPAFPLSMSNGGANAALTASNGGIVYSTASALGILSGTATANQMLLSGSSTTPIWSTVTHPTTTTANQLLYSSAANTLAGLATANSSVLTTNSSGVPSWTTFNTSNLADANITSLSDKNIYRYSLAAGKWQNTADLTVVEGQITTLLVSTGVLKNTTGTTQNTTIVTAYTDGTDSNILHGNNTSPSNETPTAVTLYPADNIGISGYKIWDGGHTDWSGSNTTSYLRYNIDYGTAFQAYSFNWALNATPNNPTNINFNVYGGNLASCYTDTAYDTTNLTLLAGGVQLTTQNGSVAITNTSSFRYIVITVQDLSNSASGFSTNGGGFWLMKTAGGYTNLVLNTDFTLATDATTGNPALTYTDSAASNLTYNLNTLLVEEAYRRIYPVIRSSGAIALNNGSYSVQLTVPTLAASSTYILPATVGTSGQVLSLTNGTGTLGWSAPGGGTATGLQSATTVVSVSAATAPTTGQLLAATSGTTATWQTLVSNITANMVTCFDTTTVNANSTGFVGGVYDGRYFYLAPNNNGQITRYDTTLPFTSTSSYSVFDTTTVNANSKGFQGGVYDGRYVYLVPNYNGANFGQITRYDTTLPFTSTSSYSVFDTTTVNANSNRFYGGVYDGANIYLIPSNNGQITRIAANKTLNYNPIYANKPLISMQYTIQDCAINTPVDGNLFVYSNAASKWINSNTITGALTAANYKLSGTIYDSETVNIANPLYSSGTLITSFGTYIPYCQSFLATGTMTINYQMPLKAANSQTKIFMLDVDIGSASDNTSWLQFSMTVVTTTNYYTGGTICYSSLVQAVAGHAQLYFTTDLPLNSPLNSNFITISRLTGTSPTSGGTTLYSGTNVYLFGMNAIYLVNSIGSTSSTSKI